MNRTSFDQLDRKRNKVYLKSKWKSQIKDQNVLRQLCEIHCH